MEKYRDFKALKQLIDDGDKYDLDLSVIANKIKGYIDSQEGGGTIKIVLMGSFSDGKTTAIAGLLGKVEDNMKIDEDESSDELSVYNIESLGQQYQIVDTPGLFGTKEKETNGNVVRFSEITERYISEAHIIIYVCNSVNTLKDSHKDIIKKVLRDYNKLASTIFVINKMDEVADIEDDEEYSEVSEIKRNTFVNRLKQVIGLTPDEEKQLNIACIAANPDAKGLAEWFKKKEEYNRYSHINKLEKCVGDVISNSDIDDLKSNVDIAVIKETIQALTCSISSKIAQIKSAISNVNDSLESMDTDLTLLKAQIVESKGIMSNRLKDLRSGLISTVENIGSLPDMVSFIETDLGIEGDKVDFNVLFREVKQIMSECAENNNMIIAPKITKFKHEFASQNEMINGVIRGGLAGMKKINGGMILKARNLLFKGFKFKPWGAVKFAKRLGGFAVFLELLLDAYNMYEKYKNNKKLAEYKKGLKDALNDIFKQINEAFDNNEAYYKNFAPSYLELVKAVNDRRNQVQILSDDADSLNKYKKKFQDWYGGDIENVFFEEVK